MLPLGVAVFCSGGGGNLKYLIDNLGGDYFTIKLVIVDKVCDALNHAKRANIPHLLLSKVNQKISYDLVFDNDLIDAIDVFILAGFMPILPACFIEEAKRKIIINTHPSLLPDYGGIGMYGVKVQEAVLKNKEQIAGCTVHYVTEDVDAGEIISQKKLNVLPNETAWELGGRIFDLEGPNLITALKLIYTSYTRVQ